MDPLPRTFLQALADRPLLRNVGLLTFSRGVTMLVGLVITAWLGRRLGPENYGIIGFAAAMVSYFGLVVASGLDTVGVREIARHGARIRVIASHVVTLRLMLAALALAGLALLVVALDRPVLFRAVIAIYGVSLIAIALNLDFVYQGRAKMGMIAAREIAVSLLALAGILAIVRDGNGTVAASVILMAALLAGSLLVALRCRHDWHAPVLRMDRRIWARLMTAALPVAAVGMLVTIYRNIDMIMLGFLRPAVDMGHYAAALKLFTTGLAPVLILLSAFTPALARAWGDAGELRMVTAKFSMAMAAVMAAVAGGGFIFAPEVIRILFGVAYAPSVLPARILMVALALAAGNICFGHPLMLWKLQRRAIAPLACGAALNAVLNFILIPRLGITGAAVAVLATEAMLLIWFAAINVSCGGRIAFAAIAAHACAAAVAGLAAHLLAGPVGALLPIGGLALLMTGPVLFVLIYAALVGPYWWRRLRRRP